MRILPRFSFNTLRTVKKANRNLKSKMIEVSELCFSKDRLKIVKITNGDVYTGKTHIVNDSLEEIYSIKDGRITASLVRKRNGKKLFAYNGKKEKDFVPMDVMEKEAENIAELKMLQKDVFSPRRFHVFDKTLSLRKNFKK